MVLVPVPVNNAWWPGFTGAYISVGIRFKEELINSAEFPLRPSDSQHSYVVAQLGREYNIQVDVINPNFPSDPTHAFIPGHVYLSASVVIDGRMSKYCLLRQTGPNVFSEIMGKPFMFTAPNIVVDGGSMDKTVVGGALGTILVKVWPVRLDGESIEEALVASYISSDTPYVVDTFLISILSNADEQQNQNAQNRDIVSATTK
ncbi:hypothetical protein HDU79_001336 [Rhizoclosmatium sp. JEL0117]|nr:hypothetical protein HDU79_001336 [Rhizoclosmatium sp. JEL0117]